MKCLVVDDDEMSRVTLDHYITQTDSLDLVGVCSNAIDALNFLQKEKVDLLFLDVEMPNMSGLDMLESMEERPNVVLITSKKEYAVQAFEYDVLDYLLKPIKYVRFLKAVNKVMKIAEDKDVEVGQGDIFIKSDLKYVKVNFKDVYYVEAMADYVIIHLENRRHIIHSTMKAIENKLSGDTFVRIHRSYIVNIHKVDAVDNAVVNILDKKLPIGASYKKDFMSKIKVL